MLRQLREVSFFLACVIATPTLGAPSLTVEVRDQDGNPVENAVVTLRGDPGHTAAESKRTMRQSGLEFQPFVLVVPVGAEVSFPNEDPVRHHVYSFSPAKSFELKLYGRGEAPLVRFDKPGTVAIGCNIHDHMRAYIHVTEARLFAETGVNGTADFLDLAEPVYQAGVWHPRLRGRFEQRLSLDAADGNAIQFRIDLKSERRRVPPDPELADY
jgi:plastocyanin